MSLHTYDDRPKKPARNVPDQQAHICTSARVLPLLERVRVERQSGRIFVVITRRYERLFGLSDAEARQLAEQLAAEVTP